MMGITNQQLFWNSIIPVITLIIGSLLTSLVNYCKEKSNRTIGRQQQNTPASRVSVLC